MVLRHQVPSKLPTHHPYSEDDYGDSEDEYDLFAFDHVGALAM